MPRFTQTTKASSPSNSRETCRTDLRWKRAVNQYPRRTVPRMIVCCMSAHLFLFSQRRLCEPRSDSAFTYQLLRSGLPKERTLKGCGSRPYSELEDTG